MSEDEAKWEDRHPETAVVPVDNSPAGMMQVAIQQGMDLEKLEKFMELQERHEAREAKKVYTQAMAAFKKNPPEIDKDKRVSYETQKGTTEYSHATLANVTTKINQSLSEHGLSASWVTVQPNGNITVTCTITHSMGHSESTSLTAEPDTSGSKNAIQAIGSTISYLERYTILALTGLATHDMDTDGQTGEVEYINEKQLSTIVDLIADTDSDKDKFMKYMKVDSVEQIPAKEFKKAMAALTAKKKKERQPGEDG